MRPEVPVAPGPARPPAWGAAGVLTTAELVWVTHTVTSSWQSSHVNSDSEAGRRDRPAPGQTRSHTCACCFPLMDPHARRRRTARSADPTPRRTTDTKPRHPALGSRAGVRVPATARSGPGGPCTRVGGGSGEGVGQSGQDCPALDVAGPLPPLTLTVRKSSFNGSGLNTNVQSVSQARGVAGSGAGLYHEEKRARWVGAGRPAPWTENSRGVLFHPGGASRSKLSRGGRQHAPHYPTHPMDDAP